MTVLSDGDIFLFHIKFHVEFDCSIMLANIEFLKILNLDIMVAWFNDL